MPRRTLTSGGGYTVGSANSATVAVSDDDDPEPPPDDGKVGGFVLDSVTQDGATVSWAAVAREERYMARWWIEGDQGEPGNCGPSFAYEPVDTNSKTFTGLASGTTYELEVVVRIGGEWQKERTSEVFSFTTLAP